MFSRIFVPLDGSAIAAQALPYAIALTEKLGSRLSLAGVILPHLKDLGVADLFGITSDTRRAAEENAAKAAVDYLQGIAAPLRARGMDVEWTITRGENAAGEVIYLAAEEDHTLIVMSTHGRTGFQRLRLGSVAQQVIRHAAEPTLVVRARENPLRAGMSLVQQITVTLDGSPLAECALPVACRFAEAFAVPLTLLRVLPNALYRSTYYGTTFVPPTKGLEEYAQSDAETYLARIAARLEITGVRTRWLRGSATPDAIITEYLHAQPPGIAVMASHGRGGISRWVIGSTAESVVRGAPCPVLIVRATTAPHDGWISTEEVGARSVKESVRRG